MSTETRLFDTIELKDGRTFTGIIDFVNTKQLYMFDFSRDMQEDFILLAILWKGYNPDIRFSVYCSINYPTIKLPSAILIPKNHIQESDKEIKITKLQKSKKRMIKN